MNDELNGVEQVTNAEKKEHSEEKIVCEEFTDHIDYDVVFVAKGFFYNETQAKGHRNYYYWNGELNYWSLRVEPVVVLSWQVEKHEGLQLFVYRRFILRFENKESVDLQKLDEQHAQYI
jgi:hypothetical protein